jgi:hypothetical protein
MTYHLRRLRLHGLIQRIPHTHRYSVTDVGLAAAIFLTRIHNRVLHIGMAHLADPGPSPPALRRALDNLNRQIDHLTTSAVPAA